MIVAFDGPDGAGKSTHIRALADWARASGYSARVIGKWDVFEPGLVPSARFLRGSDQEDLRACISEMPSPSRMLFLGWMNTMAATRAQRASEDLVILDGYWAKHAAAEMLAGCPLELVQAITAAFAPVDFVVYMDVTPEEALRRKGDDLAPYECGRDPGRSPEQFLRHQAAVRNVMLGWAHTQGWTVIHADSMDGTRHQIREIIRRALHAERVSIRR